MGRWRRRRRRDGVWPNEPANTQRRAHAGCPSLYRTKGNSPTRCVRRMPFCNDASTQSIWFASLSVNLCAVLTHYIAPNSRCSMLLLLLMMSDYKLKMDNGLWSMAAAGEWDSARKPTAWWIIMTTRKDRRLFAWYFFFFAFLPHPTLWTRSVYQMNVKEGETINVIVTCNAMYDYRHVSAYENGNGIGRCAVCAVCLNVLCHCRRRCRRARLNK